MKSKYNKNYLEDPNKLRNLFNEVQDIRYGRARAKGEIEEEQIRFNRIYVVDKRFNYAGAVLGILFLILFAMSIQGNYIFATTEEEKVAIAEFEENKNSINIMNVISNNISEFTKKEIITNQLEIEFETEYVETNLLPKDEQNIVQEGILGNIEQTEILTYENGDLIDEKIINENILNEPVKQIIEVGTSEFLANNQVHIGDTMYTTDEIPMYSDIEKENLICYVYKYIDVEIASEENGMAAIVVDGLDGFIESEFLTSENVTPGIAENSRIQRIKLTVNPEMPVNVPSGLTREDFKKVLSGRMADRNKIFENNAETFYELEEKYNVNGLFIAAIGIHESNWGTSNIAAQKKNLFGYGSYDSSAYTSSYTFESYEYGIDLVSKVLVKYYLNPEGTPIYDEETAVGSYYNGPTVAGVNTRYASDENWSNRVFEIMVSLYESL